MFVFRKCRVVCFSLVVLLLLISLLSFSMNLTVLFPIDTLRFIFSWCSCTLHNKLCLDIFLPSKMTALYCYFVHELTLSKALRFNEHSTLLRLYILIVRKVRCVSAC